MFNYEYPPLGGGGGVSHEIIAEELARRHRVVLITSGAPDLPKREERGGVEIRRVPVVGRSEHSVASLTSMLSYPPTACWEALSDLHVDSFDVVNGHFAVPTGPASLSVAKLLGIPHVLSIHGGDIYDPSKPLSPHRWALLRWVVATIMRGSDEVVAQSTNTRANAHRYYAYRGPIHIIPLGLRFPPAPAASRERLEIPTDRFVLITIGRLVARKGLDDLLRIVARLRSRRVHLLIVGSGPERDSLERLAAELGISDVVDFTGWITEERKWKLLRAADAYVSTSLHEGFGLVFLEAMAMGLPVIAPDHGGQVDFLVDGETGYVTPSGDHEATVRAIEAMIDAPADAERMGSSNESRIDEYRAERCGRRYEELFERTVRQRQFEEHPAGA